MCDYKLWPVCVHSLIHKHSRSLGEYSKVYIHRVYMHTTNRSARYIIKILQRLIHERKRERVWESCDRVATCRFYATNFQANQLMIITLSPKLLSDITFSQCTNCHGVWLFSEKCWIDVFGTDYWCLNEDRFAKNGTFSPGPDWAISCQDGILFFAATSIYFLS